MKQRLVAQNRLYVKELLATRGPDKHYDAIMTEIMDEVEAGKMEGPFAVPDHWYDDLYDKKPSADLRLPAVGQHRRQVPDDVVVSLAFSIEQTDMDGVTRIRRGKDWKRSMANVLASPEISHTTTIWTTS